MLAMCSTICAFAPEPTAIMAMTAPTPMIIPSIVKADLILFTKRALNAIRKLAKRVVICPVLSLQMEETEEIPKTFMLIHDANPPLLIREVSQCEATFSICLIQFAL